MSSAVATSSLLPEPTPRRHEERSLQEAVAAYLALALPPDAVAHHSPGEGLRSRKAQAELKRSGHQAGFPDLLVLWRGRAFGIELKAKRGTVSAAQRALWAKLEYCDVPVMLCRSVPEVEAALRECCIPLRASVAA